MKKNITKGKLFLKKFTIAKLTQLESIKGGAVITTNSTLNGCPTDLSVTTISRPTHTRTGNQTGNTMEE